MSSSNMPTGASGFVPRRSSYASVVSGTALGSPHQHSQVMRSGAFAHLASSEADLGYDWRSPHNLSGHPRHDSRGYDMDFDMNGGAYGRSGSWGRGGQLPSFSSAFGPLVNGYGYGGLGGGHVDQFFTPSYLRGSKYVQRLEDAYRAKVAAQKEGHSAQSSQPGSLSTSASSLNLHTKIAPSHRGMTYDLIEKAPPIEDETLAPLPSRWNTHDKYGQLEILSDGQEAKLTGPKSERDRDLEACAVRADHHMPPQCGIYYYEVTILSRKREESSIGIGFSSKNVPMSRLPGWEPESWAYHGDDGNSYCCSSQGKQYAARFSAGDTIGCGINFRSNSAFFTKNGVHLGTAFHNIGKEKLYPSVGMKKSGEHVRVNFGQSPFVYDIDGMMSARPDSPTTAAWSSQLLTGDSDDELPPLLSPTPPPLQPTVDANPNISLRAEVAGATAINSVIGAAGIVVASPERSSRTANLLETLEQQSTGRSLSNTERHIIRIAEGIDQHRELLLATRIPVHDFEWSRVAASERALDDLVGRVITQVSPTYSAAAFEMPPPRNRPSLFPVPPEARNNNRAFEMPPPSRFPLRDPRFVTPARESRNGPGDLEAREAREERERQMRENREIEARDREARDREARDYEARNHDAREQAWDRGFGELMVRDAQSRDRGNRAPGFGPPRTEVREFGAREARDQEAGEIPYDLQYTYLYRRGDDIRDRPTIALVSRTGGLRARGTRDHETLLRNSLDTLQTKRPKFRNKMTDVEIQQEREQIRQQIETTSTANLAPPMNETELIQSLVLQFLSHEGYVETARAFAGEVYSEKQALNLDPNATIEGVDVKEDEDAGHRQRIRKAVLEGDVDKALKYTQAFYPNVLRDNEHVSFRLKCRKFIEMIRQGAEMLKSNNSNGVKKSNGHNGDWYDDVAQGMDLDDHQSQANNWDRMDTEESPENQMEYQQLLQETLTYGQALQAEYKDDPRREISKALEDAFALMAYSDPLSAKEVAHQLDPIGRAAVAEELSSAILLSLGKSSTAALEKLIQQSTVLLEDLGEAGGPGSFVSIDDFVKIKDSKET
ncbi:hypothetical protein VTL71DRAFT_10686 [Oculimacula yallundae]|uniref:Protein ssh4 n=1 Tax=Oculimacula yallundae TaxID=86028 RepID=A0ABR4CU73_9HELO